ncbi:MAG: tail fiber domain-containing protein [Bacteroidia bacterium]|jgi:hypothetical protein
MKSKILTALTCFWVLLINKTFAQVSVSSNTYSANTNYVGWNTTPGSPDLNIKHELDQPIHFYTNAGAGTFNYQRMIIDKSPGHIGIGLNFTPGNDVLDILPDINFPNTGIGINHQTVLHNWGANNIFVGVGAGQSNTGIDNTFMGAYSGTNNTNGYANTFYGKESGMNNVHSGGNTYIGWLAGKMYDKHENTFVGSRSGENNQGNANTFLGVLSGNNNTGSTNTFLGSGSGNINDGNGNSFFGHSSGENFIKGNYNVFCGTESGKFATGDENVFSGYQSGIVNTARFNVFIGSKSGLSNIQGDQNTFIGKSSGENNDRGMRNTFIGYESGITNRNGHQNTFVGAGSGSGTASGISNASAIGTNATAVNDKVMILGDNDINVGIGMSGVAGGPLTKLQILSSLNVPQFRISYDYGNNIHTNFQTTASGDLKINPTGHFTGFDLSVSPANVVDINSTSSAISGLRLRNLSTTSNSNGKVLSVDPITKDVILVNDIGGTVSSNCNIQDIVALFDNTGNVLQCSDIYNNASATPNNRIGFFTTTPQYKFQMEGTALFTCNHISTPFGLTVHGQNNPPAVMIESKDDEGLSILHSATTSPNVKDLLKLYGDANKQYHLRMVGTPTGNSIVNSLTIDHEDNAGNVNHWLSFDPATNTCYMKDDYNGPVSGNHSKLYVEARTPLNYTGNNMTDAVKAVNNNTNVNTLLSNRMTGVNGECTGVRTGNNIYNIGGKFKGTGANSVSGTTRPLANNYGVSGEAFGTVLSGVNNYGGYFTSTGTGYVNCGVFSLSRNTSTFSYGIYSLAQGGTLFNYGIYSGTYNHQCSSGVNTCPKAAGFFNGEVYTTTAVYNTSDSSLKQNITPAIQSDTLLNNLSVYTFNYDTLNNYGLTLQGGKHYGLLAHEVRQVLPQLVKEFIQPEEYDTAGTVLSQQKNIQAVNYTEFIPLLIAGYKSQAKEIDTLTSQLTTLQSRLDSLVMAVASCCNAPLLNQNNSNNQQTIELDNTPAIILGNDPNPFAENTTITWNIPQQDTKTITAMLVFYNQNGSILKSVKIHQAGAGSLLVYGSNLSSGQYSYSLVVNNKTVKTKRMVKVK